MANFSFGNTAAKPAFGLNTSGFGFGTTNTATTSAPAAGGFFTTSTAAAAPLGGGFGAGGSSFNFGKPQAQQQQPTNLVFNSAPYGVAPIQQQQQPQQQQHQQQTSFDFGKSGSAFAVPTLGAPSLGGGSGGLFGQNTGIAQPTQQPSLSLQSQTTGLGGVDLNASKPKAVEGKNDNAKVKESQVPQEMIALVDNLRAHIKQQKEISSEIAKSSTRKLFSVQNEIQNLNWMLSDISNLIDNNYAAVKNLRAETAETIQNADMAQRTHETHANLQYENTAPIHYFLNLVQKYESEILKLRGQVELTEKHMRSLTNPQKLSAEDLKKVVTQIHESFISLASRIHDIHQKVEDQKEQYLNLRKYILHDKTNVFDEVENKTAKTSLAKISSGPTPFSTITGINLGINPSNSNKDSWLQSSNQQSNTGFGMRSTFGTDSNVLNSSSGFGASGFGGTDAFNLQKPPLGTKRNKH